MEITCEGISTISRHSVGTPTLEFVKLAKLNPEVEVMLTDKRDFMEFLVDESVSGPFRTSEIQPPALLKLLSYKMLSESPTKKFKITSFETQCGKVYSMPEERMIDSAEDYFVPISALSPNNSDFTIKARVLKKANVWYYDKPNGSKGKLFSVELMDKDSSEISATFFERGVDLFYNILQEGKIYTFSKGVVKFNNTKFNTSGNRYKITFDHKALIEEVSEDPSIKKINFNLVNIKDLSVLPPKTKVDVAGIVIEFSPIINLASKKGEPLQKRTVSLADDTGMSIELTLWNEQANHAEFDTLQVGKKPILMAKSVIIGEYNGVNLSTIRGVSSLHFNPEDEEIAQKLHEFAVQFNIKSDDMKPLACKSEVKLIHFTSISDVLQEMEDPHFENDKYYDILARIRFINHDEDKPMWYESCKQCKKKVISESNYFRCNGCGRLSQDFEYRYTATMKLQDCSGALYAVAFDESAIRIFHKSVDELIQMIHRDPNEFDLFLKERIFSELVFRIKARREHTDNGFRNKFVINGVREVDPIRVSKSLLGDIFESLNITN